MVLERTSVLYLHFRLQVATGVEGGDTDDFVAIMNYFHDCSKTWNHGKAKINRGITE